MTFEPNQTASDLFSPRTKQVRVRRGGNTANGSDFGAELVIGGPGIVMIAGPCSIESETHLRETAAAAWPGKLTP